MEEGEGGCGGEGGGGRVVGEAGEGCVCVCCVVSLICWWRGRRGVDLPSSRTHGLLGEGAAVVVALFVGSLEDDCGCVCGCEEDSELEAVPFETTS